MVSKQKSQKSGDSTCTLCERGHFLTVLKEICLTEWVILQKCWSECEILRKLRILIVIFFYTGTGFHLY